MLTEKNKVKKSLLNLQLIRQLVCVFNVNLPKYHILCILDNCITLRCVDRKDNYYTTPAPTNLNYIAPTLL